MDINWGITTGNLPIQCKDKRLLVQTKLVSYDSDHDDTGGSSISVSYSDWEVLFERPNQRPQDKYHMCVWRAAHLIDPFWGLFLVWRVDYPFRSSSRPLVDNFELLSIMSQ